MEGFILEVNSRKVSELVSCSKSIIGGTERATKWSKLNFENVLGCCWNVILMTWNMLIVAWFRMKFKHQKS